METVGKQTDLLVGQFVDLIVSRRPMHRKFLMGAFERLHCGEVEDVGRYLGFMLHRGVSLRELVEGYLLIVDDTFKEEIYFREHGRYRCSSYLEAKERVYDDPCYMRPYMIGLALTSYFWPNHVKLRRFFEEQLPRDSHGLYLEIGPGHGLYFMKAMELSAYDFYEGVDISSTSVAMTRDIIESGWFGSFTDAEIFQKDFLQLAVVRPADALVMGEVLEHVESPERFLERAFEVTTERAWFFLTTCINSPAVDHIYNPGTLQALRQLVENCGWYIASSLFLPKPGVSLEECEDQKLPVNVALIMRKGV